MPHRLSVFLAACFGMLLFGMSLITLGAVKPDMGEQFQLNEVSAGTLFSILPFGILTGSLVFGPLCDRYGYKYVLAISCFVLSVGFFGLAYANTYHLLQVFILLFGMAGGAINGATNAAVADTSADDKRSGLSLLGVFFALGALGMPSLLGVLRKQMPYSGVLSATGVLALLAAVFMLLVRFPSPKQKAGFPLAKSVQFFRDPVLLAIAFFLFCQSSFEGVVNNWTSTFLIEQRSFSEQHALYALSLFVAGMGVMRLLVGSIWKNLRVVHLLTISFVLLLISIGIIWQSTHFEVVLAGLLLLGAGLAPVFPLMLGLVGSRYRELSATAFSFVLAIALTGNMLINFCMGLISRYYGIQHLLTVMLMECLAMIMLGILIIRQTNHPTSKKS